jgi:AbrB family looped-hinge helix DNA binding protein
MQTRVSTKGQVVLPSPIRRKLGLQPGDPLDVGVSNGRVVLTPRRSGIRKPAIIKDPVTGLPVLTAGLGAGSDAPRLTGEQVREILADFP